MNMSDIFRPKGKIDAEEFFRYLDAALEKRDDRLLKKLLEQLPRDNSAEVVAGVGNFFAKLGNAVSALAAESGSGEKKKRIKQLEAELDEARAALAAADEERDAKSSALAQTQATLKETAAALRGKEGELANALGAYRQADQARQDCEGKLRAAGAEISRLQGENWQLAKDLQTETAARKQAQAERDERGRQLAAANADKADWQKTCQAVQRKYQPFEEIAAAYASLSPTTKKQMVGLFPSGELDSLLAAGLDEETIHTLWEAIARRIYEGNFQDVPALKTLFRFFFIAFNRRNPREPKYKLVPPNIGERYDRYQQRIIGRRTDGIVKEILLDGYKLDSTGQIVSDHYSLVRVEE